jgi:hypothetical protein
MTIIKFRIHLTGSRRRDIVFGILSGLAAWGLGALVFRLFNDVGLPLYAPWKGLGFRSVGTCCLLFGLFAAGVFALSRKPQARTFLGAEVFTAAVAAPLLSWALLVFCFWHHG